MESELTIVLLAGFLVLAGLVVVLLKQRAGRVTKSPSSRKPKSALRRPTPARGTIPASRPPRSSDAGASSGKPAAAVKPPPRASGPRHEDLAAEGKYEEAARLAMRQKEWAAAMGHYLSAKQPANAAHCAKRAELFLRAAELYQEAGENEAAAECWERAGQPARAAALRASDDGAEELQQRADEEALAARLVELEQPIAAAIAEGKHDRAAELYEQAGANDKAAEQWVKVARRSSDPTPFIDRIERLSMTQCHRFLELEARARPLSKATAELHYRLALSFASLEDAESARAIFEQIVSAIGEYKAAKVLARDPTKAARSRTLPSARSADDAPMDLLADQRVVQARSGPSTDELRGMLEGQGCDLGSIEVFYRLGLACLAAGALEEAIAAFAAVAEVSPGYRDADKRLEQIRARLAAAT